MAKTVYKNNVKNYDKLVEMTKELVSKLTLEEKLVSMTTGYPDFERLGIKAFFCGGEAAHGVQARHDQDFDKGTPIYTTLFPCPIGMSATWDKELIYKAGETVANEARAIFNHDENSALCMWAPTVDLERDARWGRNEEGYGEDPYLTGQMAGAYINGLAGEDENYLKCGATLKHFYANNNEDGRMTSSSNITEKDKWEYYLEVYRQVGKYSRVEGAMAAYNAINTVPCILNHEIKDVLKEEFGISHVVTDGGGTQPIVNAYHRFDRHSETIKEGLKAGIDMFTDNKDVVYEAVKEALEKKMISEEDIDNALVNHILTSFKLGLFDDSKPYSDIDDSVLNSEKGRLLSRQIQKEATCLLKNDNSFLPLNEADFKGTDKKIFLFGPMAGLKILDWYSGITDPIITMKTALNNRLPENTVFDKNSDLCPIVKIKNKDGRYFGIKVVNNKHVLALVPKEEASELKIMLWDNKKFTLEFTGNNKFLTTAKPIDKDTTLNTEIEDFQIFSEAEMAFGWFIREAFNFTDKDTKIIDLQDLCSDNSILNFWEDSKISSICCWNKHLLQVAENGEVIVSDTLSASAEIPENAAPEKKIDENIKHLRETSEALELTIETVKDSKTLIAEILEENNYTSNDICLGVFGTHPIINHKENVDRENIILPVFESAVIDTLSKMVDNTLLLLESNCPLGISKEFNNEKIPAILWSATGSEELGSGILDSIFDNKSSFGRLNMTWYKDDSDLPSIMDYSISEKKRTYMFFDKASLFPFGYGLEYSNFEYSDLKVSLEANDIDLKSLDSLVKFDNFSYPFGNPNSKFYPENNGKILVNLKVKNIGEFISDEVVEVYVRYLDEANNDNKKYPLKQLKDFRRVKNLNPGEEREITLLIPLDDIRFYCEEDKKMHVKSGKYEIMVGRSSEDIQQRTELII